MNEPPLSYCKICSLGDFARLSRWMELAGCAHVPGKEQQKQWEIAMAVRTFTECVRTESSRAIGVAAGVDPTLFWLTNHCSEVHATDLYGGSKDWATTVPESMLRAPEGVKMSFPGSRRRRDHRPIRLERVVHRPSGNRAIA